jgi:hypothetical protein
MVVKASTGSHLPGRFAISGADSSGSDTRNLGC